MWQGSHVLSCPTHQQSSAFTACQPPQYSVQVSCKLNIPAITFCHSFLYHFCLSLCNSTPSQMQRRGAALFWLTRPLVDQTLQHGIPLPCNNGGMSGGDYSASRSMGLGWGCVPRVSRPKSCPVLNSLHSKSNSLPSLPAAFIAW